jgi:hypothetical protein
MLALLREEPLINISASVDWTLMDICSSSIKSRTIQSSGMTLANLKRLWNINCWSPYPASVIQAIALELEQ